MRTMLSFLCSVLAIALNSNNAKAQININVENVQKSVVFLYSADAQGAVDRNGLVATGFFVVMPLKADATHGRWVLVTARHFVDRTWARCTRSNPDVIYMRLNKKSYASGSDDSGFEFVPLRLITDGKATWTHHTDNEVDAALLPVPEGMDSFDIVPVPISLFPTDEEFKAEKIGDPVLSAGLMPAFPGIRRNYPIFKFGQISSIPSESIATRCDPSTPAFFVKVWLIAAHLVGGNSGSPFFHVAGKRPMLLGIQSIAISDADIAGMTPVKYLYEMIESLNLSDVDLTRGEQTPSQSSKSPAEK